MNVLSQRAHSFMPFSSEITSYRNLRDKTVVVTAGTSSAPVSVSRCPPTRGAIVAQLATNPTIPTHSSVDRPADFPAMFFIVSSPW